MKTGIIGVGVCALLACCAYTHRRVIKAVIKGEPMPKAPAWHVWVREENRRSSDDIEAQAAEATEAEDAE